MFVFHGKMLIFRMQTIFYSYCLMRSAEQNVQLGLYAIYSSVIKYKQGCELRK